MEEGFFLFESNCVYLQLIVKTESRLILDFLQYYSKSTTLQEALLL